MMDDVNGATRETYARGVEMQRRSTSKSKACSTKHRGGVSQGAAQPLPPNQNLHRADQVCGLLPASISAVVPT